jgi:hypothetical protein
MTTYLLAIYENEAQYANLSEQEMGKVIAEYNVFSESIKKSGNYLAGEALQPVSTATTIRVRNGKRTTTDGPFAETKEQLGGFYLIKANNLDEAVAIASRIPAARPGTKKEHPNVEINQNKQKTNQKNRQPAARTGSIEVRPCVDFSQGQQ